MFWWFSTRNKVKIIEAETKSGFESVKKDINSISGWIKHLESEKNLQKMELSETKELLAAIKDEIAELKSVISFITDAGTGVKFKPQKKVFYKHAGVYHVQTAVQTAVQTPNIEHFSLTEKALIWVLLNTDLKLSYEDLAAMLGKERSTIRGQINAIRKKTPGLIEESIELNGKKRVFIPDKIKEKMLKKAKVRVKYSKK